MKIDSLEYSWGLFDLLEDATPGGADIHVCYEAPNISDEVECSFVKERIAELNGEYGLPGVVDKTEVDTLVITSGGKRTVIRVENRGMSMFKAETDELLRLHRFFCVLREGTGSSEAP